MHGQGLKAEERAGRKVYYTQQNRASAGDRLTLHAAIP
eukprot:COSAG06_NODE_13159_length_1287_cov_1.830808_2_plen_37_part_01